MEETPTRYNVISQCAKPALVSSAGAQITGPMWRFLTSTVSKLDQLFRDVAHLYSASMISRSTRDMIQERETCSDQLIDVKLIVTSCVQWLQWESADQSFTSTCQTGLDSPRTRSKRSIMAAGTSVSQRETSMNWTCPPTSTRPSLCSLPSSWWTWFTSNNPGTSATLETSFF